jgi:hypothetical protein
LHVAGISGSLERIAGATVIVVPCGTPGDLTVRRRSRLADLTSALRPERIRELALGPLARAARVSSTSPDAMAPLLRSATFRAAVLGVLERCPALELDGRVARATTRHDLDELGIRDVVRRLGLVSAVVRAMEAKQQRSAPSSWTASRPRVTERVFGGDGVTASGGAEAPARDVYFEGPLYELVAIGLYRPALDALCRGAGDVAAPPIDRAYLLKILDEEVGRQFSHPLRPIVELVLNGVDACDDGSRVVDVTLSPGRVEVAESGVGMTLVSILSRLLIPFATDKRAGFDIGRFGVGFFSVLGYGTAHPASFALEIATGDGREGWLIRCAANGGKAADLTCSVRRTTPVRGTRVRVTSALLDPDAVRGYVRDTLHFVPPERAVVRIDRAPINDGSLVRGGRVYEDVAALGSPPVVARYHLGGHGLSPGITAATYHAGVKVESCLAIAELALIDFPSVVELTEGRDAIKLGPAANAVAVAFHRRLSRIAQEAGADRPARLRLAEIAAQVSALLLQSAGWSEAAPRLADELLGDARFLVSPERVEVLVAFLGADTEAALFVPESFWAEREWCHYLPGEKELLERELELSPVESLESLALRRPDLGGLAVLAARAGNPATVAATLVRARSGSLGTLPCLGTRRAILVREDAAAVRQPRGWADLYALRASFDRAMGAREADVEREIIVGDPIRAGLCT